MHCLVIQKGPDGSTAGCRCSGATCSCVVAAIAVPLQSSIGLGGATDAAAVALLDISSAIAASDHS